MKISRLQTIQITDTTFISSYDNGDRHACIFTGDGESLSLSFDSSCLHKLSDLIQKLQEIHQKLAQSRQKQVLQELELLRPRSSFLPINGNGNGKERPEADITF